MVAIGIIGALGGFVAGVIYSDMIRHFVVAEAQRVEKFAAAEIDKVRNEVRTIGDRIAKI